MTVSHSTTERLQQLLPQLFDREERAGDRLIRVQLTPDTIAAIPLDWVEEATVIPARNITAIPNLAAAVMGLTGSRNHVFAVVDVARLLEVSVGLSNRSEYPVVVVQLPVEMSAGAHATEEDSLYLGLAVDRILGSTLAVADELRSPDDETSPTLAPFLQAWIERDEERIAVLDVGAIASMPTLTGRASSESTAS